MRLLRANALAMTENGKFRRPLNRRCEVPSEPKQSLANTKIVSRETIASISYKAHARVRHPIPRKHKIYVLLPLLIKFFTISHFNRH